MQKFKVKVLETLEKDVEIEAETAKQAVEKAIQLYKDQKIVLDSDNYIETCVCDDDETIIKYV